MNPARLVLGIGCRRGATQNEIEHAVRSALGEHDWARVRLVATLEDKLAEPGLVAFCQRHGWPLAGIAAARVAAFANDALSPSAAARAHRGVPGVSEPCALLAAHQGQLIVSRLAIGNVTVAVAADTLGD